MTALLYKELTGKIIGVYYDVYNGMSRTYPEFVYEKAMMRDIRREGIVCDRQEEYQVFYKGQLVGLQRLDLFTAGEVIVEIKVVPSLTRLHKAQTFSYLKAFDKRVALLFNFGGLQPEFERIYFEPRPVETSAEVIEQTLTEAPPGLVAPELIRDVVGGLYSVHTTLGAGFIHRIYANACYHELKLQGLPVRPQKEMKVVYRGEPVADIKFAHLRIGDEALVFPVAVTDVDLISFNNLKDWLRVEQIPLGILANFHSLALKPIILKA